jgi:hypothetical protein
MCVRINIGTFRRLPSQSRRVPCQVELILLVDTGIRLRYNNLSQLSADLVD